MRRVQLQLTVNFVFLVSVRCAQKMNDKKKPVFIVAFWCLKLQDITSPSTRLSFNKGSPSRKKQLEKQQSLANYRHNFTVMETGKGELIVYRRSTSGTGCNPSNFLPYSFCLGFIKRQESWKHVKTCNFKPEFKQMKFQNTRRNKKKQNYFYFQLQKR